VQEYLPGRQECRNIYRAGRSAEIFTGQAGVQEYLLERQKGKNTHGTGEVDRSFFKGGNNTWYLQGIGKIKGNIYRVGQNTEYLQGRKEYRNSYSVGKTNIGVVTG
jgi:hypothetical protein